MNIFIVFLIFTTTFLLINGQGPAPPRLSIPGAIPVPSYPSQPRLDRVIPQGGLIRLRRPPNGLPSQINAKQRNFPPIEAKPVIEEVEDDETQFNNKPLLQSNQPLIVSHEHEHVENSFDMPRLAPQDRPLPIQRDFAQLSGAQRFGIGQKFPQQTVPQSPPRPAFREQRPQYEDEQDIQQAPVRRVQPQKVVQNRPRPQQQPRTEHRDNQERERKPVAQILRKYREENEDGSITWGFENDDGSYKEEIIGNDCVTRGRYGYIDPEGNKREYNYETGNQCDPNKRDQEEEEEQLAYAPFQDNQPGKSKARPQQQQAYRN